MSTAVAVGGGAVPLKVSSPRNNTMVDKQRKLPRPIVFWSINEKTAYRRNRVVQTRLSVLMDDIATQRETSRKTLCYEAQKFRQKNGKFYNHPSTSSNDSQGNGLVNIAPQEWINKNILNKQKTKVEDAMPDSEDENKETNCAYDETDAGYKTSSSLSPRKSGIITRAKTPSVKFSMFKRVTTIENDLEIDDLEQYSQENCNESNAKNSKVNPQVRSMSALHYRNMPDSPGQTVKRQQSAFPALRNSPPLSNITKSVDISKENAELNKSKDKMRRSETFFDKSKASFQLREDLKRRAKLRKQGVKPSVFTLQDALNLEKEKGHINRDKVLDYIKRIEATKRAERAIINKWTKDDIVNQLDL